jgi:RND superfamily putative drug exporter
VCIALLGQFALGVNFLYGPSAAAAIAVALTMVSSLTFLPAMLGFLGAKVLSRKERAALAGDGPAGPGAAGLGLRWARFVEARRALVALGALVVVVVIALPVLGLRLGTSDSGTDPPS